MRRLTRWILLLSIVIGIAVATGFLGLRVGRRFERNYLCCDIPREHNIRISLQEAFGLLQFPSQIGQDRWVAERVFPGVRDGFFLDVGSADGFVDSNTWALERRGWRGICVDPFPTNMQDRRCQMFKEVVSSVSGQKVTFAKAGYIGGITDHLDRWKSDAKKAETVELTTVTLGDILQRAQAPAYVHYMSLDIEGAELEALRGIPFDRYSFGAMTIEHNFEESKRSQIEALLREKGYQRARWWHQDDFYIPVPRAQ
jgi:FkbM family methyltransferase